ncbi:MAG: hypothetical protein HY023_00125 [Chloroflexi bacterium]|nr:hypothetical protein [Chloroflexota bacterium]MBI3763535.1 hypothetical protein [Chloroflexota bacterium]
MAARNRSSHTSIPLAPNGLPASSDWLFPEYDFEKMTPKKHYSTIIERILERGRWDEINWLFDHYGEKQVKQWVRQHGFQGLSRRSFALWKLVLGIKRYRRPWWAKIDNAWPY